MFITEYRIVMPLSLAEYQIGHLYTTAEWTKAQTGGGDGYRIIENRQFEDERGSGQYTHKIVHVLKRLPQIIAQLSTVGMTILHEKSWNYFPRCHTEIVNPSYMRDRFHINVDSLHLADDRGTTDNVHGLPADEWAKVRVVHIDIANLLLRDDDEVAHDPGQFRATVTRRGPLGTGWIEQASPVMCAYKLVRAEFKWVMLQDMVEAMIERQMLRGLAAFHRQLFCSLDAWHGMSMELVRKHEDEIKVQLEEIIRNEAVSGMRMNE